MSWARLDFVAGPQRKSLGRSWCEGRSAFRVAQYAHSSSRWGGISVLRVLDEDGLRSSHEHLAPYFHLFPTRGLHRHLPPLQLLIHRGRVMMVLG